MFHKLHVQLTLFCTFVTGCIFLVLTFLCLRFAENSLKAEDNAAFLRQLNAVLIHLQEQDSISHQWLSQIQKNSQFLLYLYDRRWKRKKAEETVSPTREVKKSGRRSSL